MKPVNLLPSTAPSVATPGAGAGPSRSMIGGAVAGVVAIVGVAAYFALARVDSVKSETQAAHAQAAAATAETGAVQKQVQSLGQPVVDSDKQIAQGYEQAFVSAFTQRFDYPTLARDLRSISADTGGWYTHVLVRSVADTNVSVGGATQRDITIRGYMPTEQMVATLNDRAESRGTMKDAEITFVKEQLLFERTDGASGIYWEFIMQADFVDTAAPLVDADAASATADGTGTTVGQGDKDETPKLSVNPEPPKERPKDDPAGDATSGAGAAGANGAAAANPAAPSNPFVVAAGLAGDRS